MAQMSMNEEFCMKSSHSFEAAIFEIKCHRSHRILKRTLNCSILKRTIVLKPLRPRSELLA